MPYDAFNSSPTAVINISRDSMANYGHSPATRAAGAAACIVADAWEGIEMFFEPGKEILVARDGDEVMEILEGLSSRRARTTGEAAYRRALRDHAYNHRAALVEAT